MNPISRKKNKFPIIPLLIIIIIISITGIVSVYLSPQKAMPGAHNKMVSSDTVSVKKINGNYRFSPASGDSSVGFIFYPGAKIEPAAYAPLLSALAEEGYTSYLVPMPFNLAVLGSTRAGAIIRSTPLITNWVIGGHSLGGVMAAAYAKSFPNQIKGLILLASYPAKTADLSTLNIKVLSISGTLDGLVTPDNIESNKIYLPADTRYQVIDGANHAQFGNYGSQSGDLKADISAEDQQQMIVSFITDFLSIFNVIETDTNL